MLVNHHGSYPNSVAYVEIHKGEFTSLKVCSCETLSLGRDDGAESCHL